MGAFNGSGTFVRSYSWQTDAANGINILPARADTEDDGFAAGLSNCVTRDGQGIPTSATPWGGQNLTGVGSLTGASYSFSGNGAIGGTFTVTGNVTFNGLMAADIDMNSHAVKNMFNGSNVQDGYGTARAIGYRTLPFTASTAGRTLALADVGMCVLATGAINIPLNASIAFAIGDIVAVYNNSGGNISITASGGVTLRLGGSATTGTRTLAQRALATLLKVGTDEWVALNGGAS